MTISSQTVSKEAVNSYRKIYQDEFGELLTEGEAQLMSVQLLRFFEILNQPDGVSAKSSEASFASLGGRAICEQKYL